MTDQPEMITTPFGKTEWAHLIKPDTKFSELGDFKVNLNVSAEDAKGLVAKIQEVKEAALKYFTEQAEAEKKPGKKAKAVKMSDIDPYEELEDGSIQFKLKRKAAYVKENGEVNHFEVPLVDSTGKRIEDTSNLNIGNGSTVRCRAHLVPYNMATSGVGVSLRLYDCQIKTLVAYEGGSSGYDDVSGDDGYVNDGYSDAGDGYKV